MCFWATRIFRKAKIAQAREEYLEALKSSPDLFEANFRLAYLAFEAGQNGSAIAYYRAALAVKPHHTEANVYLGEALRRDRRFQRRLLNCSVQWRSIRVRSLLTIRYRKH